MKSLYNSLIITQRSTKTVPFFPCFSKIQSATLEGVRVVFSLKKFFFTLQATDIACIGDCYILS